MNDGCEESIRSKFFSIRSVNGWCFQKLVHTSGKYKAVYL